MKKRIIFSSWDYTVKDQDDADILNDAWHDAIKCIRNGMSRVIVAFGTRYCRYGLNGGEGGLIGDRDDVLARILEYADDLTIARDEADNVQVTTYDHDGNTTMTIRNLTQNGDAWYQNNKSWRTRRALIEHITNTKSYTAKVRKTELPVANF